MAKFNRTDCEGFYRRDFLKVGAAGIFGLSLPQLLRLEAQATTPAGSSSNRRANSVILVWLAGGPATIDMWDPKPNAPSNIRGEFDPIDTSAAGVQISEHLPMMAQQINKSTIVRSLAHTIPSHSLATVFMTTGNRPTPALQYPSIGSLMTRLLPPNPNVPPYVSFGSLRSGQAGGGGYLGTAYNPFIASTRGNGQVQGITLPNGFTVDQLENRNQLLQTFDSTFQAVDASSDLANGMDTFHQQALDILRSDATRNAFNLNEENNTTKQRYGTNSFGSSVLTARRLVESGVRFVTVSTGGWDTHRDNFNSLRTRRLPDLDRPLSALINDLDERGLLENTIVYCAGEFGRTPRINGRGGRDHWARSMAVVLAGGGFRRGYAHGTTDANGMAPANDPCTPDDIAATIFHNLGISHEQELQTPTGRPVQLFREGRVLNDLLA